MEKNKKFKSMFDNNYSGPTDSKLTIGLKLKLDLLEKRVKLLEEEHRKMKEKKNE